MFHNCSHGDKVGLSATIVTLTDLFLMKAQSELNCESFVLAELWLFELRGRFSCAIDQATRDEWNKTEGLNVILRMSFNNNVTSKMVCDKLVRDSMASRKEVVAKAPNLGEIFKKISGANRYIWCVQNYLGIYKGNLLEDRAILLVNMDSNSLDTGQAMMIICSRQSDMKPRFPMTECLLAVQTNPLDVSSSEVIRDANKTLVLWFSQFTCSNRKVIMANDTGGSTPLQSRCEDSDGTFEVLPIASIIYIDDHTAQMKMVMQYIVYRSTANIVHLVAWVCGGVTFIARVQQQLEVLYWSSETLSEELAQCGYKYILLDTGQGTTTLVTRFEGCETWCMKEMFYRTVDLGVEAAELTGQMISDYVSFLVTSVACSDVCLLIYV
ncbi:uncharacterized protein [Nicotiana tomentosiformis]|uniref:uncharacterized protein isoform X1 n=1 Tax=Nicotiana tomentosiformis TaxID=4098 RepID=UPI00388CAD39